MPVTPSPAFLTLVGELEEYLAIASLEDEPIADALATVCDRLREGGLPVARVMVVWRLLNPLYFSQSIMWRLGHGTVSERYRHDEGEASEAFMRSPLRYVLEHGVDTLRYRLDATTAPRQFPIFDELAGDGYTDYLSMLVGFGRGHRKREPGAGCIISVCSDAPGGFGEDHVAVLQRLRYMLALAIRSAVQNDMRYSMAVTYLGRTAGQRVMSGQILRGGSEALDAVVWYCDLRGSTALCERLGMACYIPLLNDFFSATAGPVAEAGGEILDFVGDAVFAIFPLGEEGLANALEATCQVMLQLEAFRCAHAADLGGRQSLAEIAGIAMDVGTLMYGNIGIAERLTFSVVGPTANRVSRLERLTKVLGEPVIGTHAIASGHPEEWRSLGSFDLDGVAEPQELFAPRDYGAMLASAVGDVVPKEEPRSRMRLA
ncbi:adenylate/guanylate cyclase domain-containing protein [Acuticoccus mangrovi]|uniref:Adenylate/guanylate cyclase domain-containing protein n=1 Tax=Acuticoccus mangrovi TaxID=2796142 RepID=A0A934MH60_9HYPH|nr:adenylate/guanylate cyclase domain-containing protein [Acuticoccus mangrovi]MBJ3775721.1 adenylate/guanylate cyclase domain-containing protein [Acuticoccus mangrovi]